MKNYRVASYYEHEYLGSEYFTSKAEAFKATKRWFEEAKKNGISKSYLVVAEFLPKGEDYIADYKEIKIINGCECEACKK